MTLAQMCQLSDINRRSLTINVNRRRASNPRNDQARVSAAAQLLGPDLQRDNPALQRDHPRRHQTA
jgi:hypothetical protein